MKAIETKYAGCRFRSRLEARWAVFFDHLGIEWQYEPEGFEWDELDHYELLHNGRGVRHRRRYLPDFYLPSETLWVEVKGDPDKIEWSKYEGAMTPDACGRIAMGEHARLVILGPIPRPDDTRPAAFNQITGAHDQLSDGDVGWVGLTLGPATWGADGGMRAVAQPRIVQESLDYEQWCTFEWRQAEPLNPLNLWMTGTARMEVRNAYTAARSARFGT